VLSAPRLQVVEDTRAAAGEREARPRALVAIALPGQDIVLLNSFSPVHDWLDFRLAPCHTMAFMSGSPANCRRRWFRFSLRSLLLLVALIAVPLAWKVNQVRNQRIVVAEVQRLHGRVYYDHQVTRSRFGFGPSLGQSPGPAWLTRFLGDDFFADVVGVAVFYGATDQTIAQIATLPHIERLVVHSDQVTDAGLEHLAAQSKLTSLHLTSSKVTRRGLAHLAGLKALTELSIGLRNLGDSQLESVVVLKQLESLDLSGMPAITDKGIEQIAKLDNLRHLTLEVLPVTDAGLLHLHGMTKLESLGLHGLRESIDGVGMLHRARPDLKINWR
jgi:hypothetical protein